MKELENPRTTMTVKETKVVNKAIILKDGQKEVYPTFEETYKTVKLIDEEILKNAKNHARKKTIFASLDQILAFLFVLMLVIVAFAANPVMGVCFVMFVIALLCKGFGFF